MIAYVVMFCSICSQITEASNSGKCSAGGGGGGWLDPFLVSDPLAASQLCPQIFRIYWWKTCLVFKIYYWRLYDCLTSAFDSHYAGVVRLSAIASDNWTPPADIVSETTGPNQDASSCCSQREDATKRVLILLPDENNSSMLKTV